MPILAVSFDSVAPSLKKIFNNSIDIYATPDNYFTTKFREILKKKQTDPPFRERVKKWLGGPKMSYWPQQLNFAVWCATTGCGISREIFDKDHSTLGFLAQVYLFYQFYVYFTVRRILYQLGGIQSISALPGNPTFSQTNNKYDVASYKNIYAEFGINQSSDFRLTKGANHGLGSVSSMFHTAAQIYDYPGSNKFSDEGGSASKGNLVYDIYQDSDAVAQADWFCKNTAEGLTHAGLSRINQLKEAFVYCVLGSQVNVRSSILGSGGRAKEAQSEFLVLVEDAIRQPDLAKSVQRYKLAVYEATVRLNLGLCPGAWLMPGRMVINTERVVGYNNQLKQADAGMKLGINKPSTHGMRKIKDKPAKQSSFKPDSQGRNKQKKKAGRTNARCPNPT